MEYFCNHGIGFLSNCAICSTFERFDKVCKRMSCVYPTATDGQIIALPAKFMIDLITVCDNGAGEIFQELSWMISSARRPLVKEYNRLRAWGWTITVHPHVGLLSIFDLVVINPHHHNWSFICMDGVILID